MAETVNWMYSVRAVGGPSVGLGGELDTDAYEKLSITVGAGVTQAVSIGPGAWTDVSALVISASVLDGTLTVKPDGGTAVPLDGPILLIGLGPVALLGAGDATLVCTNTGAGDVTVDIFVARDATP